PPVKSTRPNTASTGRLLRVASCTPGFSTMAAIMEPVDCCRVSTVMSLVTAGATGALSYLMVLVQRVRASPAHRARLVRILAFMSPLVVVLVGVAIRQVSPEYQPHSRVCGERPTPSWTKLSQLTGQLANPEP